MLKRFISYYKPHRKLFIADMVAALILAVADLFYPMITRSMINDYIPNAKLKLLIIWSVILLAIYLAKKGLNYFVQYYGHLVGVGMQADMRRDVFHHLQKLPFTYFDNTKTGTIMSRITNDLMDISELAHHGPEDLFISVVILIGSFILMIRINLWLTLLIVLILPFLVWYAASKRLEMGASFKQTRVEIGEVNATLENAISGIRVSKAYTNAAHEEAVFREGNERFVKARVRSYRVMGQFHSGTTFITDFLNLAVLVAGGLFFYFGLIKEAGDFAAFLLFVNAFMNPIKRLIALVEQLQNGVTGFERFLEIMDTPTEEDDPGAVKIGKAEGDITFDHVTFAYENKGEVLSDVSLHIPVGRTVALVGPSGGGKTTLCHLIPRFYEIDSGSIKLDGQDIRSITRESLRANIGIVQQDVFLFTGTIYENIAYGSETATEEDVVAAAKRANIHEFILSLPDGYQTFVGERGVKLSGGQKQRISIARVFLKNPPILILDEATSALDNVTELAIQKALEELCEGRTTLIVAHRLSTIKNADEIIVMNREGIVERGSHSELMAKQGMYADLYNSQFAQL